MNSLAAKEDHAWLRSSAWISAATIHELKETYSVAGRRTAVAGIIRVRKKPPAIQGCPPLKSLEVLIVIMAPIMLPRLLAIESSARTVSDGGHKWFAISHHAPRIDFAAQIMDIFMLPFAILGQRPRHAERVRTLFCHNSLILT